MSKQTNCVACDESPGSINMKDSVLVSKMYQEVTGLKIKPHYTICKQCQQELRNCYNFRKRCHEIFSLYGPSDSELTTNENEDFTKIFANPLSTTQEIPEITIMKTEIESNIVTFTEEPIDDSMHDETYDGFQSDNQQSEDEVQSDYNDPDYDTKPPTRSFMIFSCPRQGCNCHFNVSHRLVRHLRTVHGANEDEVMQTRNNIRKMQIESERQPPTDINMPESEEDENVDQTDVNDPDYEAKFEKFQCEMCPKSYTRRPQLVAHMVTHRNHTVFHCPRSACNSAFNVSHRLIRHLRNVHNADEEEVEDTREKIKAMRPVHQPAVKVPVPEGKVQCEICFKILSNKRYLKEHMELQHLKTTKYKCTHPGCSKRFKIWSLYEMHMKKHSGQHDFVCKFCGKGYVQRKIFNSHLRNSHQVSQEEIDKLRWSVDGAQHKDNKCVECKIEFKTPHKLFEHQALIHGEGKRYICDICGKAFFSKAFLSSHQKYHKGVKNRKCTKCPSAFTEDKGLRTHLRRVHHMTDEEVYALGISNH
ncbi:hypothetical protein PVAND_006328 [Polypedilum vanderplanki]|uniref:Zinc finger protein n=1 Tax=Polypedilum vanderplanki TaxID=319348 RepID=A0A9J6C2V5_POLVA|nr:hypothetical protein PVAND_006328 [Polypedilum vanderplanki]